MTPADLARALVAAPWWEWRAYTPVVESGQSGMRGARGVLVPSGRRSGTLCVRWSGLPLPPEGYMETSITHGTVIDLDHPGAAGVLVGMLAAECHTEIRIIGPDHWEVWTLRGCSTGATLAEAAGRALLAVTRG